MVGGLKMEQQVSILNKCVLAKSVLTKSELTTRNACFFSIGFEMDYMARIGHGDTASYYVMKTRDSYRLLE
jgi:hypothetical protein